MPVFPIGRREFLAALASSGFIRSPGQASSRYPVHLRKAQPYDKVLAHIEPGTDEFPFEKEARGIEERLSSMLGSRTLPLAEAFTGKSPMPLRYREIAENVSEAEFGSEENFAHGLRKWIESLGRIRRANFFVLPDQMVRYEIASEGKYRVGFWKQIWNGGRLQQFHPVAETMTTAPEPLFQDITGHCFKDVASFGEQLLKGNGWWRSRMDAATGIDLYGNNGVAAGDIDNDGSDEIYVCQPGGLPNRLYKNLGDGTFVDITDAAGVGMLDDSTSALFVDFRNSGRQDLVVLRTKGPLLFLNKGDGTFTYVPDAFHFRTDPQGSFTGMAAADYDRDGRVDLYLCCYVYFQSEDQYRYPVPYHDAENGPPNFLFRNKLSDAGGYFEDVTEAAGLNHNNNRYSFAPAWCDVNGDGWPDLYVANDFGKSNFYRNRNGRFRDEALESGIQNTGPGMSAAWFDYDGDGRPDLYVSNMWTAAGQRVVEDPAFAPGRNLKSAYHSHTGGNALYRNLGGGKFEETGTQENVAMGRWAWSADALDFDNDGWPEILVTAGMLTNSSEKDLNSFFWRQVVAKSPVSETSAPDYENGWNAINQLIREDYSWCGREPNVFYKRVKPLAGAPARFHDFSGVSGLDFADDSRAFAVTDIDNDGNLDVVLKSRLAPQLRVLRNNSGHRNRSIALRLRGTQSNRDAIGARVEVNGRVQYLNAGSGYLSQHSKQLHFGLGDANEAAVTITWPSGTKQQFTNLRAGFRYDIQEGSQQVHAAAFETRKPIASAPVHPINQPDFASTWLLEPVPLPEARKGPGFLMLAAGRVAAPPGLPFDVVDVTSAPQDLAAQYSIFRRYLFELRTDLELPLLLLIDDRSRAHKIYAELPSAEMLSADLQTLRTGKGAELALPFAGRYYTPPSRNYFKLGAAFYWAGYPDQAKPYLAEVVRRSPDDWKALYALAQIDYDAERWKAALEKYQQVLAIRPNHPGALLGAAEVFAKLGDFKTAEQLLRKTIEIDSENADAANQLGLSMARQNRSTEAKQWFERAISKRRDHTGAVNNLAVLYSELGQHDDAIAAFRYGIGVAPDDEILYLNLGRLYVQMGEREKAREVMRELLARKPGNPGAERALRELDSR